MKRHHLSSVVGALLTVGVLGAICTPALAALTPYDVPNIECESATLSSITLNVCAKASGAPAGLTIQWKTKAQHDISGWDDTGLCKLSLSGQPSLQHPGKSRWELVPGECETIAIGDINFDETGVSGEGCGLDPLECGTTYVFRWFAHAGRGFGRSDWGGKLECSTAPCPPRRCTFTQGYWKTHGIGDCHTGQNADAWPLGAFPMLIGTNSYNRNMVCASFNTPAAGNGLISLAHQLMTAKLNLANGATSCPALQSAIAAADLLIGNRWVPPNQPQGFLSPGLTSGLTATLDLYNNGGLCVPNCHGSVPMGRAGEELGVDSGNLAPNARRTTWGKVKSIYR